jgi:hypothetical protein
MPYYQDAAGAVHYFASIAFISDLPPGSTVITDEAAFAAMPTPLSEAQTSQIATLDAACAASITGGFYSNALGVKYLYPSQVNDQANLSASVQMSMMPNTKSGWSVLFWCADRNGSWGLRGHNALQIQQAGTDGFSWISACIAQKVVYETAVMNAKTTDDVQKVVWVPPTQVILPVPATN